jgi:hypothetical protein
MDFTHSTPAATSTQSADMTGTLPACGTAVLSDAADESGQGMSDAKRSRLIHRHGTAMAAWYSHYKQTGNLVNLDIAYAHMRTMVALEKGRAA